MTALTLRTFGTTTLDEVRTAVRRDPACIGGRYPMELNPDDFYDVLEALLIAHEDAVNEGDPFNKADRFASLRIDLLSTLDHMEV